MTSNFFWGFLLLFFNAGSTVLNQMAIRENSGKMAWSPAISAAVIEGLKLAVAISVLTTHIFMGKANQRRNTKKIVMPTSFSFCIRYAVPAMLYAICNILNFSAVNYIGSTKFQLLNNLKIVTTAIVYRVALKRKLKVHQWLALFLLFFAMCTLASVHSDDRAGGDEAGGDEAGGDEAAHASQLQLKAKTGLSSDMMVGSLIMVSISFMSAAAGVYNEVLVKGTNAIVWWQNVLLYSFTLSICLLVNFMRYEPTENAHGSLLSKDIFAGFSRPLWLCIILKAFYGQVVSFVFKYADNILKVYANSLASMASAVACFYFFEQPLVFEHFNSTALIVIATILFYAKSSLLIQFDSDLC